METTTILTAPHGLSFRLDSVEVTEYGDLRIEGFRIDELDVPGARFPVGTPVSFLFSAVVGASVLATAKPVLR